MFFKEFFCYLQSRYVKAVIEIKQKSVNYVYHKIIFYIVPTCKSHGSIAKPVVKQSCTIMAQCVQNTQHGHAIFNCPGHG